ncbi:hypothetical protein AB0O39_26930 [Streptomyces anulatus]|uniref:hypothetical protein n=1 Tax=Streptomyces anulatus TaxID=1892 RepID=UPI00342D8EEC
MEEVLLRLEEALFPSIAAVVVLSVDVNIAIVRVDAQGTAKGGVPGRTGLTVPTCGFPLMFPAEADRSSFS